MRLNQLELAKLGDFAPQEQTVILFSAGSLSQAFQQIAQEVYTERRIKIMMEAGSTARMAKLILEGEDCDIFVPADIEVANEFHKAGRALPVLPFVRNDIVAVTRKDSGISAANLAGSLRGSVDMRIGISDPATQPCGANAMKALSAIWPSGFIEKSLHVVTGGLEKKKEKGEGQKSDYTVAITDKVDLLLVFRSTAQKVCSQSNDVEIIELPTEMQVTAEYGLCVLKEGSIAVGLFINFLQSTKARNILEGYGFQYPTVVHGSEQKLHFN